MFLHKITLVWKDTMCKNNDMCLKIPNKYNHLSKHKYTSKNISTPITTFLRKIDFPPSLG